LDARLENLVHEKNPGKSKPVKNRTLPPVPRISDSESDQDIQQPPKVSNQIAGTQAAAFRSAYKVYLNGRYDRAVVEFQRFLRNFPNAALTPQAYYYLGDSHYIQKDYDGAAQSFRHFITNYPDNQYTPPALFKLGLIMMETHQIPQAQKLLNQVIQKYADVQEANLAKVQLTNIQNAE
jgi:tol-pal system protein YbgF